VTAPAPCPHCAQIGAIAAATQDALKEIRGLAEEMRRTAQQPTPPRAPSRRAHSDPRLSERELAVLRLAADGRSNADIGQALFISGDSAKTHMRSVYRRLGARDRAHAVALAYETGVLQAGTTKPVRPGETGKRKP
jgi:DNA-binding CsgD family transcriptional regulator